MTVRARPGLEEARAKLRELGYLQGRVERFVFRRALGGAAALALPLVATGAVAIALAWTASVAATQFRFAESSRAVALLLVHLSLASLLPATIFAVLLVGTAGRSRRPGAGAAAFGLASAAGVLFLWLFGTWRLGPDRPTPALLWGVAVASGALLFGAVARATYLARAFARSGRLPQRPRRALLAAAAIGALAVGAILFAIRPDTREPAAPLPSPREQRLVVAAIDGLDLEGRRDAGTAPIASLLAQGSTGWWEARRASPAEVWTDLATGVAAPRHGIRALEWVRPLGLPALRPPFGASWYLRGFGLALGTVSRAPVSAWERRSLAFWEVAASAGLRSLAIGWWASGPWPGATVVENREVLARSNRGVGVDAAAIEEMQRRAGSGFEVSTVYLPGADIHRNDPGHRAAALAGLRPFLADLVVRARGGEIAFVVLAVDSHPRLGGLGRMVVFDGAPARLLRLRPEDVAPSLLARVGIPVASDLPGRPVPALFRPGSLETETVATYGARIAPAAPERRDTDREYLEKLKSLGYLD